MAFNIPKTLVSLENVHYSHEGNKALEDISLRLYAGKVHAVVGDHGSGKSHISDILSGVSIPTKGHIFLSGQKVPSLTIQKAQTWGIQTVHQDINLINNFTIAENLFTPDIIRRVVPFNRKKVEAYATSVLEKYQVRMEPSRLYKDLHLSEKILINTIRALIRKPKLLILDEALEKLSGHDFQLLSEILKECLSRGMGILCLSHKIDDIYSFADSVTIIRKGRFFLTDAMNNIDRINLIKLCYSQLSSENDYTDMSKEFYQLLKYNEAILQKLPINLIVTDDQNHIKLINETGKKYFGVQSKALRDKALQDLFGKDNSTLFKILGNAVEKRIETSHYNVPYDLAGTRRIINLKTFPIYDGAFLIGNIIILEDISEQEKLRDQINLSEKLASVGLLAAGVAHEINNPLEIIYNHLNYLDMGTSNQDHKNVIREIAEELRDIKAIVSNLISFSDHRNASIEVYNLNDLVRSLINLIRFNAKHKNIRIVFETSQDEILIQTSRNEMKQVLLNLMKNSFEAMPEGGEIRIRTDIRPSGTSSDCIVTVDDNGNGLDNENTGDIFLPFYSTKKKNESNLGLGLSVIYGIIKKYNGEINASNRDGGGCRFQISLPCSL